MPGILALWGPKLGAAWAKPAQLHVENLLGGRHRKPCHKTKWMEEVGVLKAPEETEV